MEAVELYFDNALKFTTKSFGATAFGTLTANGGDIKTINSTSSTDTNSFLLANSTGNAFQLTHTSSNSYIRNLVGSLFIEPKSGETGIKLTPDAGVELFYDNVKRAETLSTSFNIYGKAYVAGEIASFNCRFLQNGNDLFIDNNNGGSANRYTQISGGTLGTSAGLIKLYNAGQVELYHSSVKKAETSSDGFDVTGTVTDDGATHNGDVTFTGDSANVVFDKSDNALEFADNAKLVFGDGGDVNIRHDGVRTILRNHGIGPIVFDLLVSGNAFTITRANLSETIARFTPDAGVELYHDNVKKAETVSNGLNVEGTVTCDDIRVANTIKNENQTNTRITFDGTQIKFHSNDVQRFNISQFAAFLQSGYKLAFTSTSGESAYIRSFGTNNGDLQIGQGTESMAQFKRDGAVELYHNGTKKAETTSLGFNILSGATNVAAVIASNSNITSHAYVHGQNGAANQALTIQADESCLELISASGGLHGGSILIRDSSNDGFGFVNDPTREELRLKSFTSSNNNFNITSSGVNTSRLDDCIIIKKDGAVSLFHDGVKKAETTSSGITVTGSVTTQDMNMSNLNGTANEVDNTKGSWSIQEGADDLFLINRVSGKKYKFNLTEIS